MSHPSQLPISRPHDCPRKPVLDRARARRIVDSCSSSGSDLEELPFTAGVCHSNADDVIEITDSSDNDDHSSGCKPLPQQRDQFDDDGPLVL